MSENRDKLAAIIEVHEHVGKLLKQLDHVLVEGRKEIDGEGNGYISQETCAAGAALFREAESLSGSIFAGLHHLHGRVSQYISPDANEGPKPWPP